MKFEWDENKNQENIKKHGIPFEEAMTNNFIKKSNRKWKKKLLWEKNMIFLMVLLKTIQVK